MGSRVTLVSLCACPIRGWDLLSGQCELTKCTTRDLVTENLCTCKQRQLVSFELDFSITFLESHLIRNKKHSSLYQHHPAKCVQGGRSAFGQLSDCSNYIKMSKKKNPKWIPNNSNNLKLTSWNSDWKSWNPLKSAVLRQVWMTSFSESGSVGTRLLGVNFILLSKGRRGTRKWKAPEGCYLCLKWTRGCVFFKAWLTPLQQKRGKTFPCADSTDFSRIDSEFCSVSITLDVCIKKKNKKTGCGDPCL